MKIQKVARGRWAEKIACDYLLAQGLQLLQCNYQCRGGEIDLIMQQHTTLIFVEVRYRQSNHFMHALESIDLKKQQHLITAATHFLQQSPALQTCACRFDVVSLMGKLEPLQIQWIKNAFTL